MKKYLSTLKERDGYATIVYIDRSFEILRDVSLDSSKKGVPNIDSLVEDFRPCLYERLSDAGKRIIDDHVSRCKERFTPETYPHYQLSKEEKLQTSGDNKYMNSIWEVPLFVKESEGVCVNALYRIGFPLGYCLERGIVKPEEYAKANVLYEQKPQEEYIADVTQKVVEIVGLKKGFETYAALNMAELSVDNNSSFKTTLENELHDCKYDNPWKLTYYYETLTLYDKYEKDIKEVQAQMLKEGRNPFVREDDPDDVKDKEVRKAYAFVLEKIDEKAKEIDKAVSCIPTYRKKNYGIAKEILNKYDRERTMTHSRG